MGFALFHKKEITVTVTWYPALAHATCTSQVWVSCTASFACLIVVVIQSDLRGARCLVTPRREELLELYFCMQMRTFASFRI